MKDEFADVEAMAYIAQLYKGASPIEDTPALVYLAETRRLPLFAEDAALLRWIGNYRGDDGALLYPVTDDGGQLVALFGVYVTFDGESAAQLWALHSQGHAEMGRTRPIPPRCTRTENGRV